jgi:hypothetical protein
VDLEFAALKTVRSGDTPPPRLNRSACASVTHKLIDIEKKNVTYMRNQTISELWLRSRGGAHQFLADKQRQHHYGQPLR